MPMKRRYQIVWVTVLLLLESLPFLAAGWAAPGGSVFSGFLINPIDGNSYLAKMYQGWSGSWTFHLPFSMDRGQGGYVFLYYLFLGHLARLAGLKLIWTYHLARLLGSAALILGLRQLFARVFPGQKLAGQAWILAGIGAGCGWLVVLAGLFPGDLWVAEAYPFLAGYANPHFPASLALAAWLTAWILPGGGGRRAAGWTRAAVSALALAALATLLPFAAILALGLIFFVLAAEWAVEKRFAPAALLGGGLGGGAVLLYQFWLSRADPVLAAWMAQNLTPPLPAWNILVSFAPALLLALPGALVAVRRKEIGGLVLAGWALVSLLAQFIPIGLERRFLLGWYIPLAGLAVLGCEWLRTRWNAGWAFRAVLIVSIPTNLILMAAGWSAARSGDPAVTLRQSETRALDWLAQNTPADALVLAAPDSGLLIPAYTGRRVLYGHPFETVNAAAQKERVTAFYTGALTPEQAGELLQTNAVGFVLDGPREQALGRLPDLTNLVRVYDADGTAIYRVGSAR